MTEIQAIPQPPPHPEHGHAGLIDGNTPVQSLMRLARMHGPIYQLNVPSPLIVVSSQELVDEVCDTSRFDKSVAGALRNVRDFTGDGLFTAHTTEQNWAVAHRLLMPAFGPLGIRGMFDKMLDIADQMLLRWERFGPSNVIDVADDMTRMTLDTIGLCAFDFRFNSFYQRELHPFIGAMVDALAEAGARTRRTPEANQLLLSSRRKYEHDLELMKRVADEVIAERKRDPRAAEKDDLLATLLNGRDPITGEGLSDENIRYQLVTFLIAGHETTSGLLTFTTYFLLRNPEVLAKARAEVDAVLGDDPPTVDDIGRLKYVEQTLLEALRIWPTAAAFTLRALDDTVIGGRYPISRRDTIMVISPQLHRDTTVWGDDVESFRPERFAPELMAELPPNAWKPFGNGQRACIGRPFAMQEAVLLVAMMLQRFDLIEDDPSYQLRVEETLTLKPKGFRIRAKSRGRTSFAPRSVLAPRQASTERTTPVVQPPADATPLYVLFGSNTGSAENFAQRVGSDAAAQGYAAEVAPLDDYAGHLPTDGPVIILAASYEGQPTDNARQFVSWADGLASGALTGVRYAVFGCGNRQWARTYQAVPSRLDEALARAGATRLRGRGETDAGGDFFGGFDDWYADLWADLGAALGKDVAAAPAGHQFEVEVVEEGRASILRLGDLEYGEVVVNRELVDMSSPLGRSKRHIEIALPEGMTYRAGDYLAVLPHNPVGLVMRALKRFDLASDSRVVIRAASGSRTSLPVGHPIAASELLFHYVELGQPATRSQVAALAALAGGAQRTELAALAEEDAYQLDVLGKRVSLLDLLERHPGCPLSFAGFLEMLPPARARQYSISSSPLWNDERCSITVAVVDAPAMSGNGRFQGMASSYLANCPPGTRVTVAVRTSHDLFHPPAALDVPMVMVCAGTGLAPFRGFLQERAVQARNGRTVATSLLFFGCDHPDVDLLYRDELAEWEAAGIVSVRPAYFKAPEGDVTFVQHRLWQDRADVADAFNRGANVYVCGDGRHMAPAVRETIVRIYQEATSASDDDAQAWADRIEQEAGRYVSDVFA
ncbi:cytochrome P450 [Nocardioides albidus]|uniref:Bifunctional cytochrome P450/NADPH--P450 reductase n=1 Tax=Nocardioides albidus TaxID=1517589 RepID=A0A5C4VXA4_9ACTN|nr:cytochrome P450 [Nocardioides albidus]TNM40431.1 cytochrome P450 [Nocardioides albidus]